MAEVPNGSPTLWTIWPHDVADDRSDLGLQNTFPMRFRPATMADAELLLAWRNEESTRSQSFDVELIELPEHRAWLRSVLSDPDRSVLIGLVNETEIGAVRLEREAEGPAVISVIVAPSARGRGLGRVLIDAATRRWFNAGGPPVHAHIKAENIASQKAFAAAGFVEIGRSAGRVLFAREQ